MAKLKLGVLISGRGSNLQALIDACAQPDYPAEIVTVISNRAEAQGLARAAGANLNTQIIDHKAFPTRAAFDARLSEALRAASAELICLAGFMRLLQADFFTSWSGRIINIHPSLLPAFRGLRVHERVLAEGVRITGCTVHYVRPEMDAGPIIAQAAVPVLPHDTADTLAARVLEAEHVLYPLAVRLIASGAAILDGDTVTLTGAGGTQAPLISPPADA